MLRNAVLTFVALTLSCASVSGPAVRVRSHTVQSRRDPKIEIRVDPALAYLGHIHEVAMDGRAEFDEYLFSEIKERHLGRTFIAHFEHVRPGVDFAFKYPRMDMVTLDQNEYLHQSWPAEDWDLFETAEMKSLLMQRDVTAPRRWLVDRYVRTVGTDRRAELIFFYIEPATDFPAPVHDLGLAGSRRNLWLPIGSELAKRARAAFTVHD